jgi:hypothetical protein
MKKRAALAALPLAVLLTACGASSPTAAPERAAFDGGSFGPGHNTVLDSAGTANRGGSFGPGH